MRTVVTWTIALLLLTLVVPAGASDGALPLARKAYALAKQANLRASKALASQSGPIAQGIAGERGTDGLNGKDGAPGPRGAEGAAGRVGDTGSVGPQGPAGTAQLAIESATNPATVVLGDSDTTVAEVTFTGLSALITFDAQVNAENANPSGVYCALRADAQTLAERFVSVPGASQVSIAGTAPFSGQDTPHTAGVVCHRTNSVADVEIPAERARVSVLEAG